MIEATTDRNHIMVRGVPYAMKDAAKSVSGCRARYDEKVTPRRFLGWQYPLTLSTCYALRRVFGVDLQVLPPLSAWAREELAREPFIEAIRTDGVVDLSRVQELAPDMFLAMQARPYQPVGASFIVNGVNVILGDDPGLGKTMQTLAALVQKGARFILVLCPKSTTRSVWVNETNRWAPTIMPFVAQGTHAQREQVIQAFSDMPYTGPKMLVINKDMIAAKRKWRCPDGTEWDKPPRRKGGCKAIHNHKVHVEYRWPFLFKQLWDAIVCDESQEVLASTKNTMSNDITQTRLGAMHLRKRIVPNGVSLALSGTPWRSDLKKAWGTLNWLRPDVFPSFWRWAEEYFEVDDDGYGKTVNAKPRNEAAFNAMLRPYFLGREKGEVAKDLIPVEFMGTPPPNNKDGLKAIWLEMEGDQARAYHEMERDAETQVEGGKLLANGVLAEITRLRQFAISYGRMVGKEFEPALPSNKVDWILEFLLENKGNPGKVVIASEFSQHIELVAGAVRNSGEEILTLTGNTSQRNRDHLMARFQDANDPLQVVAINMKAGGVGITLDRADYMLLLDVPWKSDVEKQVVDRIHRVSRVHPVFVYRLLSLDTLDEWMAELTEEQRAILLASGPAAIEMARGALAA